MTPAAGRRGPPLPYDLVAGVAPCRKGWVVAAGKLIGVSLYPEPPTVVPVLRDVLDHIPSYGVVALAAPVGLPDVTMPGGRTCDRKARLLLGFPRLGAVASAPGRSELDRPDAHVDAVTRRALPRIAEVDAEVQPYRQRTVYAVHPELCFFQLAGDRPLIHPKRSDAGVAERKDLLLRRMATAERVLAEPVCGAETARVLDALAALWTARRIAARAATRIPADPEWDATGLRMEWVF